MRSINLVAYLVFFVSFTSLTQECYSAVLTRLDSSSPLRQAPLNCTLSLDGPITPNDSAFFDTLKADDPGILCLNSEGGSYDAALKIATVALDIGIATVVPESAGCFSACAIIFMAGSTFGEIGTFPSRSLHIRGKIGFHAPYLVETGQRIDTQTAARAYRAATAALGRLIKIIAESNSLEKSSILPMPLLAEMLVAEPNQAYEIDTVGKAIEYKVSLIGLLEPAVISKEMACTACTNISLDGIHWPCDKSSRITYNRTNGAEWQETYVSIVLGPEDHNYECKIIIDHNHKSGNEERYISYERLDQSGSMPAWELFPAETKISKLPSVVR